MSLCSRWNRALIYCNKSSLYLVRITSIWNILQLLKKFLNMAWNRKQTSKQTNKIFFWIIPLQGNILCGNASCRTNWVGLSSGVNGESRFSEVALVLWSQCAIRWSCCCCLGGCSGLPDQRIITQVIDSWWKDRLVLQREMPWAGQLVALSTCSKPNVSYKIALAHYTALGQMR